MIKTSMSEVENKIRSKESAIEFFGICLGKHLPRETAFNSNFIRQVFRLTKKLLPLSAAKPPELKRMKFIKQFDRENLFSIINNNDEMKKYIPDDSSFKRISREVLLAVRL